MKKKISVALILISMLLTTTVSAGNFAEELDVGSVRFDIQQATAQWKGDGVWTEGEYYEIFVEDSWRSAACGNADHLEETQFLDYTLGMSWDSNYIYGYLSFHDSNGHEQLNGDAPNNMWISGCLHIAGAEEDAVDKNSLKHGIAVTSDTNKQIGHTWIDYLSTGYDPNANVDYYVVNNNNDLVYEWRTPIAMFSGTPAKVGTEYAYCLSLGWGNDGSRQHSQIGAGLSGGPGEQAGRFPRITLAEAPVAETVAELVAEDAPTETQAPATFDAGVLAAAGLLTSLAGFALKKKR